MTIRHERAEALKDVPLENIMERYTKSIKDIDPDWHAFADSHIDGLRRAQHRFIGAGGSGKFDDPSFIPAEHFTLSVMFIPPGEGGSAHSHEVEEVFFVLQGVMTFFLEDADGRRVSKRLGKWECISCPAGVLHGFRNDGVEPAYLQTMIGTGRPGPVGFSDAKLFEMEQAKLAAQAAEAEAKKAAQAVPAE